MTATLTMQQVKAAIALILDAIPPALTQRVDEHDPEAIATLLAIAYASGALAAGGTILDAPDARDDTRQGDGPRRPSRRLDRAPTGLCVAPGCDHAATRWYGRISYRHDGQTIRQGAALCQEHYDEAVEA